MKVKLFFPFLAFCFFLSACIFSQKPKEFTLRQDETNITEISRVFVTWNQNNQKTIEIKETVSGELLASALQALRELPCKEARFEPLDDRGRECFQINFVDGSFQLLDMYSNVYFDKDGNFLSEGRQEFDEAQFLSLWNRGFGS